MDYYYNDEHDEDDIPVISLPNSSFTKRILNDNTEQKHKDNNRPSILVENWRSLYETSINSLQSDDEDQRTTTEKSFYLHQNPSIEKVSQERPYSPVNQSQFDSNKTKSKWEIRLPELLNGTVGPDRQKRNITRRYTTNIILQVSNPENSPYSSSQVDNNQHLNPLVKQLKQKFDRMISNDSNKNHTQSLIGTPTLGRMNSLTCRGLTANTNERLVQRSRTALLSNSSTEATAVKPRSTSTGSINKSMSLTNGRIYRDRTGPPISYSKHFYPPPSTTSVVKQLIGGGATLVYDSITQQNSSKPKSSNIKHQRNIEETKENFKDTVLTGRQLQPKSSTDGYSTIDNNRRNRKELIKSKEVEPESSYYEPISGQTLNDSIEKEPDNSISYIKKSNNQVFHTERSHYQIPKNDNESGNYYAIYDTSQRRDENED